jgi:tetratricopeptide (TPR) repeat protein
MKNNIFKLIMSVAICFGSSALAQDTSKLVAKEARGGITDLLDEIAVRDKALAEKDKSILKLEAAFEEMRETLSNKVKELKSVTSSDALEKALEAQKTALSQRDEALKARDEALSQRDEAQKNYDDTVLTTNEKIRILKEMLKEKQDSLNKVQSAIEIKDAQIAGLQSQVDDAAASSQKERLALVYNLGCIYKAAKQYKKAETEFLKALDLSPDDSSVHYNLGILYDDNLNDAKKARKHYKRFLELAPNDKDASNVVQWMKEL